MWGSPHAGTGATECYPNSPATASAENALLQTHMGHGIWPVPKTRAAPAYIKPSVCLDAASKTWVVVISGLDERMCKTEMIEAMLDQAQVAAYVQSCRVKKVCNACELKRDIAVAFSTREAAKRCVQHFNGRQWGVSGSVLKARLQNSVTRLAQAHSMECGRTGVSQVNTQHIEDMLDVPPGLVGLASLAATPNLPPPGLEAVTLQTPPGLSLTHEQEYSKWQAFAEDSTDAGTSVVDDDPADEEAQIIMSL